MKKKWIKKKLDKGFTLLIFLSLIFLTQSCYESKEGCLDIRASNFDFDADNDCCLEDECCCEYPSLTLDIVHKLFKDSVENFDLGTEYEWPIGQGLFVVENIRFYLSKFELHGTKTLHIEDLINLNIQNQNGTIEEATVEDNFVLIRPGVFSYDIGEIRGAGSYDSLSMQYGVFFPASNAIPESLPDGHPLAIQEPVMQINAFQGYINCQVILKKDTFVTTISDTLNLFSTNQIPFEFTSPQTVENGLNKVLKLRINYLEWFQGIDFALDSNDELISKMSNNLTDSFEYNE